MMGKSGDNEAFGGDDGVGSGWIGVWFSEEKGEGGEQLGSDCRPFRRRCEWITRFT